MATTTTDAPEIMRDTDGTPIGPIYELEIGTVCALTDGGFMLDFDQIVGRSDLEQLHALLGKVLLDRATGGGVAGAAA